MLRSRIPWWAMSVVLSDGTGPLSTPRRGLKTLDVREYKPLGTPIEFRFYQRYSNHPNRQSGIQFLTHYNTHQRFRVNKDFIDYFNWGKEQGQARLPHRWQRVAFDFDDALNPTRTDRASKEWFAGQDPSVSQHSHPDLSTSFDPRKRLFSQPEHWNKFFSKRAAGEGDIRLDVVDSQSMLGPLVTQTDTQEMPYFKTETRGPTHGKVPGINMPFLGEFDRKMVQAMSRPMNKDRTITANEGRFSKTLFINDPARHQTLSASLAKDLNRELDRATTAVYSKLTVLQAAQSGRTDYFCGGVDTDTLGFDLAMAAMLRERAAAALNKATTGSSEGKKADAAAMEMLRDADRHRDRADALLREHADLIWRVYTAQRPLMTLVNGKCRGTGCGVALSAKFCALKDTSEFVFEGPELGLTPYGGMTRLLARPETTLKYPGLAEFTVLTGTSLFAGDALRLGWTDLFTTLPDMAHHIKEWFDASEHMHNDAVAWQLGHLLETCFKMKQAHSSAMERAAMTPARARWVEDAFADQPSVEAIATTLGQMERLPLTDRHNTADVCMATPFTLGSVEEGIARLEAARLRYSLSPWDITAPEEEVAVRQASEIFTSYVLQRRGEVNLVVHRDAEKLRRWQAQREREYAAFTDLQFAPHPRHVYARLEGCEGTLVEFDFDFNSDADVARGGDGIGGGVAGDGPGYHRRMLARLQAEVLRRMGQPAGRDVELGWYLPTLDTCPVHSDEELTAVLHADPGLEDATADLKYPPLYFIVKRNTLHLSEWAYAVKHQLLLQSPFALKASLAMLQEVRGDTAAAGVNTDDATAVRSLAVTMAVEHRYHVRAMQRSDFYAVGQHTARSADEWEEVKEERRRSIHKTLQPTRPLPDFEAVFERDVEVDGHSFALRPRWSPRTLAEVTDESIASLRSPLSFDTDGVAPLCAVTHSGKADRLAGMIDDAGGLEVVTGLGEVDAESGRPRAAPLKGNARVPTNVNFYEMARHPWEGTASSWRRDGLTAGSKEYFEQQYQEAQRAVHDEEGRGVHSYWPSRAAVDGHSGEAAADTLLQERLHDKVAAAEQGVEGWARTLRCKVADGKLRYRTEIASQQEKIYDDEYYRWFIEPGLHPNRSGLLLGRKHGAGGGSQEDKELESFLSGMLAGAGSGVGGGGGGFEAGADHADSEDPDEFSEASLGDGPTPAEE